MIVRRRKRPAEVATVQWTGTNEAEVQTFTGDVNFCALDEADRADGDIDPQATAKVYDRLHSTWVLVFTGQHIVRGVVGELYPIAEFVLAETYDIVDEDFFQPGHGYTHRDGSDFRCVTVTAHPQTGERLAMGWHIDSWGLHYPATVGINQWRHEYDGVQPPADTEAGGRDV
ncbi:hypothetical protein [Streptomyces sp. B21-083]|uniref:hypothetical protein n=1 Tax=Streptomyces sp. B21-083 TaxID=3039410 RepID=UPI002FF37C7E